MWTKSVVFLFLVSLSTDTFKSEKYLSDAIRYNKANTAEMSFARKLDLPAFHEYRLHKYAIGSKNWLASIRKLAVKSSIHAITLAKFYQGKGRNSLADKWFQHGVKLAPNNVQYWHSYLQYLHHLDRYQEIVNALSATQHDTSLLDYLLNAYIGLGELGNIHALLQRDLTSKWQQSAQQLLDRYQVLYDVKRPKPAIKTICENSIQMFATNLKDLQHTEKLIADVQHQPIAAHICFAKVRYISATELECTIMVQEAIKCNEFHFRHVAKELNSRYIGVVLPRGKANVNGGVLYLDRNDTVDVFTHEIWHLLGFTDEYALPSDHIDCLQNDITAIAHNVVVSPQLTFINKASARLKIIARIPWRDHIKSNTPLFHQVNGLWQLGTPETHKNEVGLFPISTCDKSGLYSFKPVHPFTALEYQETQVPKLYYQLYEKSPNAFIRPSFHYNLALASELRGNRQLAKSWLSKIKFQLNNTH